MTPAELWSAEAVRRLRPWAGFGLLLLSISFLYGLLTGSPPFGTVALWEGWVRCMEAGRLPCEQIGYPIGVDASVASTVIFGTYWLTRAGISVAWALNILAIVSIAAGLAGLWYLGRRLGGSHVIGALAGAVYFGSPLVIQHLGLFQLFVGFSLLPVPLALTVAAVEARSGGAPHATRRLALVTCGLLVAGLLLVYLDPYPWVVAGALAAPFVVISGAIAAHRRAWRDVGVALLLMVALAVPGLVFRAMASGEGLESQMPIDFYRGMGVDLGVATIPTTGSTLGDITTFGHDPWIGREFTGDGSQLASSYLGIPLLALAAGGVVVLARERDKRALLLALVLGGGACLALSFGPSLKLLDRDPTPRGDRLMFGDYLMPAGDASLDLPWASIFERQPIASMRATYRWQSGGRMMLTLLAASGVLVLARRRPAVAVALGLVLVLDAIPIQLWDRRDIAEAHEVELDRFVTDMQLAFGDGRLHRGERVLFLPAENDYLMQYIAPTFDVRAYNLSFDKAIVQIRPQQPRAIRDAIETGNAGTLTPSSLCELFQDDILDAVVFDDFNLRWDSYRWPPRPEAVATNRAKVDATGILDTPGLTVDRGHLSVIVRAQSDGACRAHG